MAIPTVSFTIPLPANGQAASGPIHIDRATALTGTVYADVDGTIFIDQSGDGLNWDTTTEGSIVGGEGQIIDIPIITPYWQIRYINGSNPQSEFRAFVSARDPYGAFLATNLPPSPGGDYIVLMWDTSHTTYRYLGRFNGSDALGAITNAAVNQNVPGKYAALPVGLATVSVETIQKSTEHSPDSF